MSQMSFEIISCPDCGKEHEVEIWSSINITIDPTLRDQLFAGDINIFRCACGFSGVLGQVLLYHDMDKKIAIHYYPPNYQPEKLSFDPSTWPEMPEYLGNPKIVSSLEEMCELVELLEMSN